MSIELCLKLNNFIGKNEKYKLRTTNKIEFDLEECKYIFVRYFDEESDLENILDYKFINHIISNIDESVIVFICGEDQYNELSDYIYNFESIRDYILGIEDEDEIINTMINTEYEMSDIIDFMYYCKDNRSKIEPENEFNVNEVKMRLATIEFYIMLKNDTNRKQK